LDIGPIEIPFSNREIKRVIEKDKISCVSIFDKFAYIGLLPNSDQINYIEEEDGDFSVKIPKTQLLIGGCDLDIKDEITDFISKVTFQEIPEADVPVLRSSLSEILNSYKPIMFKPD